MTGTDKSTRELFVATKRFKKMPLADCSATPWQFIKKILQYDSWKLKPGCHIRNPNPFLVEFYY
jgi:hypothetical protein